jgi:hypothetical protein
VAGEPAEDGECGLDALAAYPVQRPHKHDLEAAEPGVGQRLAEYLAMLHAAVVRTHLEHVLAGDLEALALRPLPELFELVGSLLLGLGDPAPDHACGHGSSVNMQSHIYMRSRPAAAFMTTADESEVAVEQLNVYLCRRNSPRPSRRR